MSFSKISDIAQKYGLMLEREEFLLPDESGIKYAGDDAGTPKSISVRGTGHAIYVGSCSDLDGTTIAMAGNNCTVVIGAYAKLRGSSITVFGDGLTFWFGAFSTAGNLIATAKDEGSIYIMDECMFSNRVFVDSTDHHSIYDTHTGQRINFSGDVLIHRHVWVGRDCRIAKGSVVGENSIVGQASGVSGEACAEAGCVYAGLPARKLRSGVTWSRMRCSSLSEMLQSQRHNEYMARVASLKQRCVTLPVQ